MKIKYIISCQYKEWYGDEDKIGDPNEGRHKNKGSHDLIIEVEEYPYLDTDKVMADFNAEYDRVDRHGRYEAKSIEYYSEPSVGTFKNGRVDFGF